ncbi:MAG: hypothetical protein RQ966_01675 [Acetobacteraceae bacterium]|nr:hypothetical protein [Acetobacteraceae bacterium]
MARPKRPKLTLSLSALAKRALAKSSSAARRFETRAPSAQTAVDLFSGQWATDLGRLCAVTGTGASDLLDDARVTQAAACLGRAGSLDGMAVLELGPLEAAHTYQLERLGAAVTAVEANKDAFLKCLVVKELLGLRSRFLCGDVLAFLDATPDRYDLIFASGILYHMSDPVRLIQRIAGHADRCFLWTHYYAAGQNRFRPKPSRIDGFDTTLHEYHYGNRRSGQFWGGTRATTSWMERDEIVRAFHTFGLTRHAILGEDTDHPAGPAFSVAFWR